MYHKPSETKTNFTVSVEVNKLSGCNFVKENKHSPIRINELYEVLVATSCLWQIIENIQQQH